MQEAVLHSLQARKFSEDSAGVPPGKEPSSPDQELLCWYDKEGGRGLERGGKAGSTVGRSHVGSPFKQLADTDRATARGLGRNVGASRPSAATNLPAYPQHLTTACQP
ncbi:hypothetical protein PR048_014555 [Dryococelus australis]|uniref:Uncharacterized protein n=1 Tax=Dryococelus australis TaxID=614101 RepID=A0ABQ9HES7_9NEOP|nr:hypothetical protein PR048_014555 [Dryococelus australis]